MLNYENHNRSGERNICRNANEIFSECEILLHSRADSAGAYSKRKRGYSRLVLVSDGMCSFLGIPRKEMILYWGTDIYYYIHPG